MISSSYGNPGEVVVERVIEVEFALGFELENDDGDHGLGEARDAEQVVGLGLLVPVDRAVPGGAGPGVVTVGDRREDGVVAHGRIGFESLLKEAIVEGRAVLVRGGIGGQEESECGEDRQGCSGSNPTALGASGREVNLASIFIGSRGHCDCN